jgi:hypothetical protein
MSELAFGRATAAALPLPMVRQEKENLMLGESEGSLIQKREIA